MSAFSPGDIVEIETNKGLAYVQVTHRQAPYPEVVRALAGLHARRPADLAQLARHRTAFLAMIPLAVVLEQKSITGRWISSELIPDADKQFPTFKMAVRDKQGNIAYWWFWDGDSLRYDERPGPDTETMPPREIMTADALLARLAAMNEDIESS